MKKAAVTVTGASGLSVSGMKVIKAENVNKFSGMVWVTASGVKRVSCPKCGSDEIEVVGDHVEISANGIKADMIRCAKCGHAE